MYFTILDRRGGRGRSASATSPDGSTWAKHEGPVLTAELDWERGQVDRPRVADPPAARPWSTPVAASPTATAWSEDGIAWQRDGELPVITRPRRFPISGNAWDAALVYRDGALDYYLEIGSASGCSAQHGRLPGHRPLP